MNMLFHELDAQYAAMPDAQVELLWRHAVAHDPDAREPLLRQLVLRSCAVIDQTCRRNGIAAGFSDADIEHAYTETTLRLMSRLRVDTDVRDIRALAHQLAHEVVADPDRRRVPETSRFAVKPAQLRVLPGGEGQ